MSNDDWLKIVVVRHGETQWNAEGRWQGWQNSNLTERGKEQARQAAEIVKVFDPVAIYCSDSGRAQETAEIIAEISGVKVQPESGLRERFYGEFEGLNSDEIEVKFPRVRYEAGRDLRDTWRPPGGETLVEVGSRVMATIRSLAAERSGQTVVLVTHAGVLRVLDALSCGRSLDEIWDNVPPNCAVFVLEANTAGDLRVIQHFAESQSS